MIENLIPILKVGIRPQLSNRKTNELELDFLFEKTPVSYHVLNSISPAFTSSFAFAEKIVKEDFDEFDAKESRDLFCLWKP